MPKEYEKFKAEWAQVLKEVNQGLTDMRSDAAVVAQTSGIINEGVKEVGMRVAKLKEGGASGDDIKDYLGDKEVKDMMQGITEHLAVLEKELKRVTALHSGPWVKSKKRFWDLRKELVAEIAARKKQVSTKVGLGNKSLPDMVKLLAEIDKVKDAQFITWDAFVPEEIAQHRKELNFNLKDAIAKSKEQHLSEYQSMMMEQGLNVRVLKGNFNRAKTLYQNVLAEVAKGETALKEKKAPELKAAKLEAARLAKELVTIVDPYEKAPTDSWLRTKITESKDRATIETGIKNFVQMKTQANLALAKIAKAKVG